MSYVIQFMTRKVFVVPLYRNGENHVSNMPICLSSERLRRKDLINPHTNKDNAIFKC